MKILQIHNFYQFKGGEDCVVEAERRMLEKAGNEVIPAFGHNDDIKNLLFARKQFYKNLDLILENNTVEIAHIHNVYHIIGNGIYKYLAQRGIPIIQTLHNFRFLCPAGLMLDNQNSLCERCINGDFLHCFSKKCYQHSYIKSFLMQWLVKNGREMVVKYVTTFITLNPFLRDKFIESGFSASKFIIKPNFIFFDKSNLLPSISHQKYALFLGRLSSEKGVETIVETFKSIDFSIKIAGTGNDSYVNQLLQLAKNYPHIEFIGHVSGEKKNALLQNASFVIIPSICYDNFPMTLIESYSFAKPVIASAIGGLPFIVQHNKTGFLFEPGNSEALGEAVKKIIDNNRFFELGQNARRYFLDNFTEKQNYPQLLEIYEAAIAANKKS